MYYLIDMILRLPYFFASKIILYLSEKGTIFVTNVFAGPTSYTVNGWKTH